MTASLIAGRTAAVPGSEPVLTVENLGVNFGAFRALSAVSLDVWPGEIVGVIGPNGAGKSTLVNALAGVLSPNTGNVLLQGKQLRQQRPARRARLGLVRTFQTAELFGSLSVRRNIALARRGRGASALQHLLDAATSTLRLDGVANVTADKLSGGQRKLVELTRALAAGPQVLLLDEPVAGVPSRDRSSVLGLMRQYVDETKGAVLLIEHDMEFVSSICDWVYVMNAGQVIAQGGWNDISTNRAVLDAYLGTTTSPTFDNH